MNNITYRKYENYSKEEIMELYNSVGWISYTEKPEMLCAAYANSLYILGAYIDNKLIGIIRVIGDGHSIIYIQDIIVHPSCQRKGIGSVLLNRVLEKYSNVYQKILLTNNEEKTVNFYESIGFTADYKLDLVAFGMFN